MRPFESGMPGQTAVATLTCGDEPLVYCEACWEREFGEQ
jgi:hypothetical protein